MVTRTPLSSAIHAFSLTIAMLVEDIERGSVTRKGFAKRLRDIADEAEAVAPEHLKSDPRLDLQIARHVASLLDPVAPEQPAAGWNPVVIEGGQSDPPPRED